jgi:UDP:flavonoid glycosyltransferase YjiC (YdhE family)
VGEFVEIGNLTASRLSQRILRVTSNPTYRDKARWFQKVLGEARGLETAADIIERVFGEYLGEKASVTSDIYNGNNIP